MSASFLAALNHGVGHELLRAYAADRSDANRNALGMHYALCAQVVARQVYRGLTRESRRQVEVDDVEQSAIGLLLQLVERYDVTVGVPLSAFLTRRLRYGMIDWCRGEGLMVRTGRGMRPKRVRLEKALPAGAPSPLEEIADREALTLLKRTLGAQKTSARVRKPRPPVARSMHICSARPPGGGVLPAELQRAKEFRRWMVRRVPWAYRKLVAYRYLRGRDIDWTASRLGISPDKARVMDRHARPMMLRVVEEYRGGAVLAA